MKIIKHANCDKCKLCDSCKTPFMESHGADDPIVLVIGEAPGATEDKDGIPFVGKSGQLLRDTLLEVGFKIKDIRYTNVVRCRPPENKITKRAINYCKHYVLDEIEHYDPDLVILCGNSPLNAVLGESGITTWNGVVVEREGTVFVPVFHPAYVLRNQEILGDWFDALDKAVDVLVNGQDNKEFERIYPSTLLEVLDMADYLLSQDLIAYDTETGSLDPFAPHNLIPCVSFSAGDRTYAVPLEHSQSPFTGVELDKVVNVIEDILTAPGVKLIGHNVKFDQMHTRHILDIEFKAYGDTMLVSHMLDSRRGIHGLKRLAGLHLGMYDYDKPLNDYIREHPECNVYKGGSYANIILDVLLPYAALDTEATLKLWKKLFPKLSKKQQSFFLEVIMGASNALAGLEYNGNAVDTYIAERYVHVYSHIQRMQYESLLQDRSVHRTVAHFQKSSDMKIVDDITSRYADPKIKIGETHITYDTGTRKGKRKRNMIEFNPNSANHLRYLYFREYKIPVTGKTESGLPSTAADIMRPFIKDYPVVKTVTYYKLLTKMLGTYIQPAATGEWLSGDGRVRSSYNLHGTRTGRLCVAKGTNIEIVRDVSKYPHGIPIEDVKIGDLAYTYDFDGSLTLRKVVWAGKTGTKSTVRIHWRGQGYKHDGYVDLTPEHEVLLTSNEWVCAGDLLPNDRVMAMSRSDRNGGYSHIYATGIGELRDHRLIAEYCIRPIKESEEVHHINGNKKDNRPNNLKILQKTEHNRLHARDRMENDPKWPWRPSAASTEKITQWKTNISNTSTGQLDIKIDEVDVLSALWNSDGKPTKAAAYLGVDYGTLMHRCKLYGIDWEIIRKQFNNKGQKLTYDFVKESIIIGNEQGQYAGQRYIGLGYYKWKWIQEFHGFKPYNHVISRVEYLDEPVDVYDLEIETTHNFIANEICVHNSSSSPNMQNIPTPEKEADNNPTGVTVHLPIKNIFTHTFDDGVLMSVDYSGMELRVFASLAACEPMLEIHRMGGDFHSMVALMAQTGRPVADISKEESQAYKKQYPEVRYRYKWTNWTLLYGGDKFTLISLYGMSQEDAESTVDSYYKAFPEVLEFREYCVAFAEDNGYIESPFGRREHLPYISDRDRGKRNKDRRSAVNMPVQSSASDILLCALVVIDDQLRKRGLRTMLVNTVHDSIVLDVPRDEICTVADLCVSVMENITIYAKDYFPSVDFSWLKSPLKADVEVGTHYGTEINYKEWLEEQNAVLQM